MNKIIFLLIFSFISILSSCKKDKIQEVNSSNLSIQSLAMLELQRCDGKILLQSSELIDGNVVQDKLASGTYSGVFYDNKDEYVAAGSILINREIQLKSIEEGKRNLLSDVSSFDLLGKENKVTFTSSNADFKSFNHNIYFPKKLSVKTSIENPDFLEKTKSLKLDWISDPTNQDGKIYFTICALGKPCKLIEIDDKLGTYTVESNEFNNLQQGDKVFINIFRGNFNILNISKKNIIVGAYISANLPSVIVK